MLEVPTLPFAPMLHTSLTFSPPRLWNLENKVLASCSDIMKHNEVNFQIQLHCRWFHLVILNISFPYLEWGLGRATLPHGGNQPPRHHDAGIRPLLAVAALHHWHLLYLWHPANTVYCSQPVFPSCWYSHLIACYLLFCSLSRWIDPVMHKHLRYGVVPTLMIKEQH